MDEFSERRLVENEVIFRDANQTAQQFIEQVEGPHSAKKAGFYCECSNLDCRERIELTAEEYKRLHQNKRHFVVVPGHEMPQVEKVIQQETTYSLIEKFVEPPAAENIAPL